MTHYVDGVRELPGDVAFPPLGGGQTSIGVRQNLVSFFKGRIAIASASCPDVEQVDSAVARRRAGAKKDGGDERTVDGRVYNVQSPTLTYYRRRRRPSTAPR